jgi:hypothetical protein
MAPPATAGGILDAYIRKAPAPANAVGIFEGEWASKLPAPLENVPAGVAKLFEDPRLTWANEVLGGLRGRSILELGPLEGGHSYMMDRLGAKEVIAVEANTRAYLKCLISKELLGMPSVRFLCGDFMEYLRDGGQQFDVCVASGVLYHMVSPVETLSLISRRAPRVFIWTHYYDEALFAANPNTSHRRVAPTTASVEGLTVKHYRYDYGAALDSPAFCGGSAPFSHWLPRADILAALRAFGYVRVETAFEQPDHVNGPAFCIAASRDA